MSPASPGPAPEGAPEDVSEDAPEGTAEDPARRAARLLRWYPRAWRERYGTEFAELLMADMAERPRSLVRTLDVARGGVVARLAEAGLTSVAVPGRAEPANAGLGALGCCVAVFLVVGAALWSQLTIGWQWSPADGAPTALATVVTSAAMLALLALLVHAGVIDVAGVAVMALALGFARQASRAASHRLRLRPAGR